MPRMAEVVAAYYDTDGRLIEVYASRAPRREVQPLRSGGTRTSGRKTQAKARLGIGSFKGVK